MERIAVFLCSLGALNAIYANIIVSLVILLILPLRKGKAVMFNGASEAPFWLLFFFGLIYVGFGELTIRGIEFYLFTPIIAYLSGWSMIENAEDGEKIALEILYLIAFAHGVHAFLNYITNIGKERWLLTDFFSGSIRAATGSGMLNTMVVSLFPCFLFVEKRKKYRVPGFALACIAVMYGLLLGTRTQFVIMAMMTIIVAPLYFREKYGWTGAFRLMGICLVVGAISMAMYNSNIGGIRTTIEHSNLFQRFNSTVEQTNADNYRFESVFRGITRAFEYPFGGLKYTSYYHNMWLDVGRVSGLIPMVLLMLYSINTTIHMWRLFRDQTCSVELRYACLSIYGGILINFFMEPILEGLIEYFLMFCRINGMVDFLYYSHLYRRQNQERHPVRDRYR